MLDFPKENCEFIEYLFELVWVIVVGPAFELDWSGDRQSFDLKVDDEPQGASFLPEMAALFETLDKIVCKDLQRRVNLLLAHEVEKESLVDEFWPDSLLAVWNVEVAGLTWLVLDDEQIIFAIDGVSPVSITDDGH